MELVPAHGEAPRVVVQRNARSIILVGPGSHAFQFNTDSHVRKAVRASVTSILVDASVFANILGCVEKLFVHSCGTQGGFCTYLVTSSR